ncbi:NUDIX hydrolase, partial [Elusimicrobiota bacterium]
HETLKRECKEETGLDISVGKLLLIRDYISKNHEFAHQDNNLHQVKFMFGCKILNEAQPIKVQVCDETQHWHQTGVEWLEISKLDQYRIYPCALKQILKKGINPETPIYLGDVN